MMTSLPAVVSGKSEMAFYNAVTDSVETVALPNTDETAVVRVLAAKPGVNSVLAVMRACAPWSQSAC